MTPRELALHLLELRFGGCGNAPTAPELAAFQQDAQQRLLSAIARYGGALLADGVGLGKTHVAAAVARSLASPDSPPIAVVPASLLRMWRRALRDLERVTLLTHATLSRSGGKPAPGRGIVIVDEAHAFRNPRTRRYAALARLTRGRAVLLLTATPINNSVWDLYWLLRLFLNDDAFSELGVTDLAASFDAAQHSGRSGRIPAILAAVAVRRSRAVLAELHGEIRVRGRLLTFPRREPPRPVRYELPDGLRGLVADTIEALELRPWQDFGPAAGTCLLRLTLLKRLESSAAALRASLFRLHGAVQAFAAALDRGLLLAPADRGTHQRLDPSQLEFDVLVLRPLPPACNVRELHDSAGRDLERLTHALSRIDASLATDPKINVLHELLRDRLHSRPVLLFTEFRETAEYLWRSLRGRIPTALIHGSGAWLGSSPSSRRIVVERFAPLANGVRPPSARERVHLLIATDVLAEGLNLQDAADVLSYDLPWNPVRLVQRLGRIDRLGSPHTTVRSWYFVPERALEELLGLLQRIRAKLRTIRSTIGAEAPVLAPAAAPAVVRALAAGDAAPLVDAERAEAGLFETEERLRAAYTRACGDSANTLAGTPLDAAGKSRVPHEHTGKVRGLPTVSVIRPPTDLFRKDGRSRVPTALVVIGHGAAQRAVFVAERSCWEDDVTAGKLLLSALAQPLADPLRADAARRAQSAGEHACRWLSRSPQPTARRSAARQARARLLRLLDAQPGGPTVEECRRAERLILRLQQPLPAGAEVALRALLRQPGGHALDPLFERLERELQTVAENGPPPPRSPGARRPAACRIAGVFLLDSGG